MGDGLTLTLRLGTRGSPLARAQSGLVADALRAAHAGLTVEMVEITTAGDRTQHTNLPSEDWGRGVFVREIEQALLDGRVDLAVHSLKDLPPAPTPGLVLAAIPERAEPFDVLVTREGTAFETLPAGARVGTSSARRAAFLRAARPDLAYEPIRGNVDTRWRKVREGEYDAVVLAAAGLARLELHAPGVPLDPHLLPPAPGQGALAVQARADDAATCALAAPLHHPPSGAAVTAERTLMDLLDGGCRLPVAALGTPLPDGRLHLAGAVAAPDGSRVARAEASGSQDAPAALAEQVAARLRDQGAAALTASAREVMSR